MHHVCARHRADAAARSVLWHSADAAAVAQSGYASCPAVATSDHVPVYAAFNLTLPQRKDTPQ